MRLVVPCPASSVSPEVPSKLASAPVALVTPAKALMLLAVLLLRDVAVTPLLTADADSETTIVTTSSTWLARTSRAASASRDPATQIEPGVVAEFPAERASASLTYLSSGDCAGGAAGGVFFLPASGIADNATKTKMIEGVLMILSW